MRGHVWGGIARQAFAQNGEHGTWREKSPIRQRPAGAINRQSFAAILSLAARFNAIRESHGLTLAEVAERMGIDPPALSRSETVKLLNPALATPHKWAEALGRGLEVGLSSG